MRISSRPDAVAIIRGEGIRGIVRFFQKRCGVQVEAQITGLPDNESGFFAFHIHQGFDCGGKDFGDTGGHYNPDGAPHPRHAGDLPPLLSAGGKAYLKVETNRFRLPEVLGRTVVIHSEADDFHTQPAGNAGSKIACGVIRRM